MLVNDILVDDFSNLIIILFKVHLFFFIYKKKPCIELDLYPILWNYWFFKQIYFIIIILNGNWDKIIPCSRNNFMRSISYGKIDLFGSVISRKLNLSVALSEGLLFMQEGAVKIVYTRHTTLPLFLFAPLVFDTSMNIFFPFSSRSLSGLWRVLPCIRSMANTIMFQTDNVL